MPWGGRNPTPARGCAPRRSGHAGSSLPPVDALHAVAVVALDFPRGTTFTRRPTIAASARASEEEGLEGAQEQANALPAKTSPNSSAMDTPAMTGAKLPPDHFIQEIVGSQIARQTTGNPAQTTE